jgi:SAM-dependent methyltransferase
LGTIGPTSVARTFLTLAVGPAGTQIAWQATERALSRSIVASTWSVSQTIVWEGAPRVMRGDVSNLRNLLLSETFDVILSSLVLHYVEDLTETFREWSRLLRPSGTLVFSTHHPIHQASLIEPGYLCAELIEEEWGWLGEKMRYYRRPLRDLTEPLTAVGFVIERINEPTPGDALKIKDPKGYERLCRLPAFIFI